MQLFIENTKIFDPDSYSLSVNDILTDNSSETEAGTKQFDFVRKNIHVIELEFTATSKWSKRFSEWRNMDKVNVQYTNELGELSAPAEMRIVSYNSTLNLQSRSVILFNISFTLEEI